jgi:N-acetylglucosaminyldiphosphoundecaprenol N-acetyl-beta-D-mannosaminyltransferase
MNDRHRERAATQNILGYAVDARSGSACIADTLEWVRAGDGCRWLACINPHSYAVARADPTFADALRAADWLIPDGAGIVVAARTLHAPLAGRVTGSDLFEGVHRGLEARGGGRVFLLGSTEETLARIRARSADEFPNVAIVGTCSPPFRQSWSEAETTAMVDAINAAEPDVLWVGMTAPKQEKWIRQNHHRLHVRFAAAIGAVFDFYAGNVKRSHPLFQRAGLEWLPRLVQEPRRLWRRTFVSAPVFLWDVARAAVAKQSLAA